jgi:hypothetical protein
MYTNDPEFVKQLELDAVRCMRGNPARAIAAKMLLVEIGARTASFVCPQIDEAPRKPAKARKACPKSLRKRVFAAFHVCEYCGSEPTKENYRTVDRIDALGAYVPGNVTMACLRCNSLKGRMEYIGPARSLSVKEAHNA